MLVNEEILSKIIRIVPDSNISINGVVSRNDALNEARRLGLDLVEVSPNANPPVCKIVDYGKFCFEKKKKEKESKKNQKITELKKIRLSVKIDSGDFNTKLDQTKKFILGGDKVEVSIRFKGRELQHADLGIDVLKDFCNECYPFAEIVKAPRVEGKHAFVLLSPLSSKTRDARKKEEEEKMSAPPVSPVVDSTPVSPQVK